MEFQPFKSGHFHDDPLISIITFETFQKYDCHLLSMEYINSLQTILDESWQITFDSHIKPVVRMPSSHWALQSQVQARHSLLRVAKLYKLSSEKFQALILTIKSPYVINSVNN
jgi:hypothetical protein